MISAAAQVRRAGILTSNSCNPMSALRLHGTFKQWQSNPIWSLPGEARTRQTAGRGGRRRPCEQPVCATTGLVHLQQGLYSITSSARAKASEVRRSQASPEPVRRAATLSPPATNSRWPSSRRRVWVRSRASRWTASSRPAPGETRPRTFPVSNPRATTPCIGSD